MSRLISLNANRFQSAVKLLRSEHIGAERRRRISQMTPSPVPPAARRSYGRSINIRVTTRARAGYSRRNRTRPATANNNGRMHAACVFRYGSLIPRVLGAFTAPLTAADDRRAITRRYHCDAVFLSAGLSLTKCRDARARNDSVGTSRTESARDTVDFSTFAVFIIAAGLPSFRRNGREMSFDDRR